MAKKKAAKVEEVVKEVPSVLDEVIDLDAEKTKPVEKKEEFVQVKKDDLENMIQQLSRNAKDIDLLYKASDKSRMAKAMGDGGEILIKKARIWTWKETGKFVISTQLISNRSEISAGKWIEDQRVQVVLEDGEVIETPYLEFSRSILNKVPADIISREETMDATGKKSLIFKLQLENGKEIKINSAFVN